jgi:hypothetical protein
MKRKVVTAKMTFAKASPQTRYRYVLRNVPVLRKMLRVCLKAFPEVMTKTGMNMPKKKVARSMSAVTTEIAMGEIMPGRYY